MSFSKLCVSGLKPWKENKLDLIQMTFKSFNMFNKLNRTEDNYLLLNHSHSDDENKTKFDDV